MRARRTYSLALVAGAAAFAVVLGGAGFALSALPFLALVALLVSGRFVGEERILAFHRERRAPLRRRPTAARWHRPRPPRVRSLFARSPRTLRGPPIVSAA
jgi:hypothetical protein